MQLGANDQVSLHCIGLTVPLAELYIGAYLARGIDRATSASR
jgi:hypothetical protein